MIFRIGIIAMALFLSIGTTLAQPKEALENRRTNWLITTIFPDLDTDKSMDLSMDELKAASGLMNFFSDKSGFKISDTDNSNSLSMAEVIKMSKRASAFTKKAENEAFDELMSNKKVAKGALGYLIRKDEITTKLFSNSKWISENKDLVKKLLSSKKLLDKKPEVVKTLLSNRSAMMSNPGLMKDLLANSALTSQFPEFLELGDTLTKFLGSEKEVLLKRMKQGKNKIEKMKGNQSDN